jgi:hypothetical protein
VSSQAPDESTLAEELLADGNQEAWEQGLLGKDPAHARVVTLEELDRWCEENDLGKIIPEGQGVLIPGLARRRAARAKDEASLVLIPPHVPFEKTTLVEDLMNGLQEALGYAQARPRSDTRVICFALEPMHCEIMDDTAFFRAVGEVLDEHADALERLRYR